MSGVILTYKWSLSHAYKGHFATFINQRITDQYCITVKITSRALGFVLPAFCLILTNLPLADVRKYAKNLINTKRRSTANH